MQAWYFNLQNVLEHIKQVFQVFFEPIELLPVEVIQIKLKKSTSVILFSVFLRIDTFVLSAFIQKLWLYQVFHRQGNNYKIASTSLKYHFIDPGGLLYGLQNHFRP